MFTKIAAQAAPAAPHVAAASQHDTKVFAVVVGAVGILGVLSGLRKKKSGN